MLKKIIGWTLIALLTFVDFTLVNDLLLQGNSAPLPAFLGALLFCVGLDGGPTFLGIGLIEFFDATRTRSGIGRMRSVIFMIVGGFCTLLAFLAYIYIRRDAIQIAGGQGYEGYYGDLILAITPFITSLIAFGISLWVASTGIDEVKKELMMAEKEFEYALAEKELAETKLSNALSTLWGGHFPDTDMPSSAKDVIGKIRSQISGELESRLQILLPQLLTPANMVSPFISVLKELAVDVSEDEKYLEMVEVSNFPIGSNVGDKYEAFQTSVTDVIPQIIQAVTKGGVNA